MTDCKFIYPVSKVVTPEINCEKELLAQFKISATKGSCITVSMDESKGVVSVWREVSKAK